MSQSKDGPKHGTTVAPYLPGMTGKDDTVQRYIEELEAENVPARKGKKRGDAQGS